MMQTLQLALRLVGRDWRAGELRVLIAAVFLAVASVGTVGFFADRVKAGLAQQANLLLGADLMISGDRPLPALFADEARRRGLATSAAIRFNSMVQPADGTASNAVLTDVKAVAAGYPLRGAIALVEPAARSAATRTGIPASAARPGSTRASPIGSAREGQRSVAVGEATLTVTAIIAQDPEIAGLTFAPGPKLLLNLDDVPATNLLQPGNRATWRLLVAEREPGETRALSRRGCPAQRQPGQRIETVRDLRRRCGRRSSAPSSFLGSSALVAVLLAAVAVALAASRYLRRHLDAAAMLRCFGAPVARTLALFVMQFAALGIAASVLGHRRRADRPAAAGRAAVERFVDDAAAAGVDARADGVRDRHAAAVRLRAAAAHRARERAAAARAAPRSAASARRAAFSRTRWAPRSIARADRVAGAATRRPARSCSAASAGCWSRPARSRGLLLALLKRVPQRGVIVALRPCQPAPAAARVEPADRRAGAGTDGAAAADRRARRPACATGARACRPMRRTSSSSTCCPIRSTTRARGSRRRSTSTPQFKPMVRGRLVEVNGTPLDTTQYDGHARAPARRARVQPVVDATELPRRQSHRRAASSGRRRRAARTPAFRSRRASRRRSASSSAIALTFDIAAASASPRRSRACARSTGTASASTSSRCSRPARSTACPRRTSPHSARPKATRRGSRPRRSATRTSSRSMSREILRQMQGIIDRVARAVEFVFLFTLAGGLLVLQAAIASTQDERKFDAAILRTLGASQRQLQSAQATEFLLLGALAGLLGAAGATAIGWALADRVFNIRFSGESAASGSTASSAAPSRVHARRLARHARRRCASRRSRCCASSAEIGVRDIS